MVQSVILMFSKTSPGLVVKKGVSVDCLQFKLFEPLMRT